MSLTTAKVDEVTVLISTSDATAKASCCGILDCPVDCSVSQDMKRLQKTSHSVLGTLHIVVGFLCLCVGGLICSSGCEWRDGSMFPALLGGLLMLFGIVSILSEKYPSPGLVIFDVVLNIVGVLFAIIAIVLYSHVMVLMWWLSGQTVHGLIMALVPLALLVLELCVSISSIILDIQTLSNVKIKNEH